MSHSILNQSVLVVAYLLATIIVLIDKVNSTTLHGSNNETFVLTSDVANLTEVVPDGFGGVQSYCATPGELWTLYKDYSFNGEGTCTMWTRPWTYCRSLSPDFTEQVRSAKEVPFNHLTVFEGENFNGASTIFNAWNTSDVLINIVQFQSYVISGGIPITFFERPYYQGHRICRAHSDGIGICENKLEGFPSGVGSIKLGICIEA